MLSYSHFNNIYVYFKSTTIKTFKEFQYHKHGKVLVLLMKLTHSLQKIWRFSNSNINCCSDLQYHPQ